MEEMLFQNYEVKSWNFSEHLYKAFIISAIIHAFFFTVVSQIDLFGTKACDSPYINKVCQVLETAYVSSLLLGTDTEFSSREYQRTELSEEDEVTFIDLTSDQFKYPPGYFETVRAYDPDYSENLSQDSSGSLTANKANSSDNSLLADITKPQTLPTPNPNPVVGDLPKPQPLDEVTKKNRFPQWRRFPYRQSLSNDTVAKNDSDQSEDPIENMNANTNRLVNADQVLNSRQQNVNRNPNQNANQPNQNANQIADLLEIEQQKLFNKKPLEDFGMKYGQAILNKELDLNAPFEIEVKAGLDEFGKLVKPLVNVKSDSDSKMVEVAKEAISAFSDSQLLLTLYNAGVRFVTIKFAQDKDNLQAIITSDAGTPNRAAAIQSSIRLALQVALSNMKPESDEVKLMSKAEISAQGKIFIINFLIPHNEKMELIEKNLRSLQEKLKKRSNDIQETLRESVSKESAK